MKALDTAVLLGLLQGDASVRAKLRHLRGVELATTEANLLELACIAGQGPSTKRSARLAALARLRRRITVLPLDARSTEEASRRVVPGMRASPHVLAMLGALEANGCDELITDDPRRIPGKWSFRVGVGTPTAAKKR